MIDIMYRRAVSADTDALSAMRMSMVFESRELEQDVASKLYSSWSEYFVSGLKDGSYSVCVAENEDRLVAMGGISYFRFPPTEWCTSGKTAYIGNMYTSPDFRNRGVASKILSMLMNEAEELGVERVILKPTEKGKSLYEKYGFDPWSDAMVFFI